MPRGRGPGRHPGERARASSPRSSSSSRARACATSSMRSKHHAHHQADEQDRGGRLPAPNLLLFLEPVSSTPTRALTPGPHRDDIEAWNCEHGPQEIIRCPLAKERSIDDRHGERVQTVALRLAEERLGCLARPTRALRISHGHVGHARRVVREQVAADLQPPDAWTESRKMRSIRRDETSLASTAAPGRRRPAPGHGPRAAPSLPRCAHRWSSRPAPRYRLARPGAALRGRQPPTPSWPTASTSTRASLPATTSGNRAKLVRVSDRMPSLDPHTSKRTHPHRRQPRRLPRP